MTGFPLAIYCNDTAHLRGGEETPRVAKVETLLWRPPSEGVGGYFIPDRWGRIDLAGQGITLPPREVTREHHAVQPPQPEQSHDLERRWRFECKLCHRTVTARDEKLSAIGTALFAKQELLEADEETGGFRVSLAWLQRATMLD